MQKNHYRKVSVIIPVYNEEESIVVLVDKVNTVLSSRLDYEIIIVDDGSTDNTLTTIKEICEKQRNVFYVSFSRNFGHQNALRAGFYYSSGEAIITMDGDLQHPPELITEMIDKWEAGFEVVLTTRKMSNENSAFKRYSSMWYYRLLNRIADVELKQGSADFRLLDRKVVDSLKCFDEKAIFYRGLVAWVGFKQCELVYTPGSRKFGDSKYSIRKMFGLAIDGIISLSIFPLRVATLVGMIMSILSFLYVLYAVFIKLFTENAVSGWLSIMAGIYFLGGIQLVFLGLHGEYIGKIFMEVKNRPNYIISETNLLPPASLKMNI
jgi:polyisoprenyl-phosphate glycosyltransferase